MGTRQLDLVNSEEETKMEYRLPLCTALAVFKFFVKYDSIIITFLKFCIIMIHSRSFSSFAIKFCTNKGSIHADLSLVFKLRLVIFLD